MIVVALALQAVAAPAIAGEYSANQTEIAAGLQLSTDGRFRYALSYGALDESAEGRWSERDCVLYLTSDPVKAPEFALIAREPAPDRRARIAVEPAGGLPEQLFSFVVRYAGGRAEELGPSPITFDGEEVPVAVTPLLSVFEVAGTEVPFGRGVSLRFRFTPNDLGRVAFADTPLAQQDGAWVLQRHGRTLRFRRQGQIQ
jgi:hypothetical protein